MWDPEDTGQAQYQRSPFPQPITPPTVEVCDPPLYCFQVNGAYIPIIAAALTSLFQRSTWATNVEADRRVALRRMADLLAEVSNAAPCTQTPVPQDGQTSDQLSCNLAGYIAYDVIRESLNRTVKQINQGLTALTIVQQILNFIPEFAEALPFVYLGVLAISKLAKFIESGTISHYQDALGDDSLWQQVTCIIYNCIQPSGSVTTANFGCITSGICAISYTHSDVISAICGFVNDFGVQNLMAVQAVGSAANFDCSCTGTPTITGPKQRIPLWQSGKVDLLIDAGLAIAQLLVTFDVPFGDVPAITIGTDDPLLLPSVVGASASSFIATVESATLEDFNTSTVATWIALPDTQ